MKITNNLNLPKVFLDIIEEDIKEPIENVYHVTEILSGIREINLTRENFDRITKDVSEFVPALLGTATHHILELKDDVNLTEMKMRVEVLPDMYLSGRFDAFRESDYTLIDYKTTSTFKVVYQDFEDWHKQGLMYAWMMSKNGIYVDRIQFIAILKDWSKSKGNYDQNYPDSPVYVYEFKVSTSELKDIETFILSRFKALQSKKDIPCTESERWRTPTKFAAMKQGRTRALKVCDTKEEAETYGGDYVEERPGEDKKCDSYCDVKMFCPYYRSKMSDDTEV